MLPRQNATVFQMDPASPPSEENAAGHAPKHRLERSGTFEMKYLEDQAVPNNLSWEGAEPETGWKQTSAENTEVAGKKRRWIWLATGAAAALGTGAALWMLMGNEPASRPEPIAPAPERNVTMAAPAPEDEERKAAALKTWKAFATASPEEKVAYVLNSGRVAAALRVYYAETGRSDAELADLSLELVPGAAIDRQNGIVMLGHKPSTPNTKPLLLFFKEEKSLTDPAEEEAAPPALKLDWETFVQERDDMLAQFVSNPDVSASGVFRLVLERVHVFDDAPEKPASTQEERFGLKLRTASAVPLEAIAEVDAGSALHKRVEEQLRWNKMESATVKLAWKKNGDAKPKLILTDFICWQYAGVGGKPEFETDLTPPFAFNKSPKESPKKQR